MFNITLVLTLILMLSLIYTQLSHPLALMIILIIQTITGSILMNLIIQFPWFSYILTLMFLGGMLILFMYMSSLVSNEMMKMENSMITLLLAIPVFIIIFMNKHHVKFTILNINSLNFMQNSNMMFMISKPFNLTMMPLTIFMAIFIITSLLAIIKMLNTSQGPLRLI